MSIVNALLACTLVEERSLQVSDSRLEVHTDSNVMLSTPDLGILLIYVLLRALSVLRRVQILMSEVDLVVLD